MAYIQQRGDKWRAFVLVDNKRKTKTFRLKREAVAWANEMEEDGLPTEKVFRDILEEYRSRMKSTDRGTLCKVNTILKKCTFAHLPITLINSSIVSGYRDARLVEVSPLTVSREMSMIAGMFSIAVERGWIKSNPVSRVRRPTLPPARRRGVSQTEIDAIVAALNDTPTRRPVAQMFLLAIETGMRLSEMLNLTWDKVFEKHVTLKKTKNGDARDVPLSVKARAIIQERRGLDAERVFPLTRDYVTTAFLRTRDKTSHKDVRFHDSRSEAVTRLSKRLPIMDLARIIGHRDMKSLLFYYNTKASDLADML